MKTVNWGLIPFRDAWERQRELADRVTVGEDDTLVLCEHPDVITLGRTTQHGAVISSMIELSQRDIDVVEIDRGGEATVHGPGQLVGYPVFHLQRTKPDLHWFLRTVEQCIIDAIAQYGIIGHRVDGRTGVWVDGERKICAIGIHCKRWVITHGFALNVSNDLGLFNTIIPCGITDKGVTSVQAEAGRAVDFDEISRFVVAAFAREFVNVDMRNTA